MIFVLLIFSLTFSSSFSKYDPTWESLDKRPLPIWYDNDKFGIFMHWGVYSVVGMNDAWFEYWWRTNVPEVVEFMKKNYPPNFTYADFAAMFTNELFDPNQFAEIVKKSGARYYVLTSKHHEGFTMWPSNYSWNWNSFDNGPHSDIVGDLAKAMRARGVRFGLYYSLMAWFHPLYMRDQSNKWTTQEYVRDVITHQLSEIINTYRPDVLWSDTDTQASPQYWNATEFIAWLYNESPVKDTVVTNDRWGDGTSCRHGDFWTCSDKYNPRVLLKHKWENCMTIDRESWAFRRDATYADILSTEELIENLVSTVSCGGNLLLNVGPTHYGKIAPIFEERLTQMGEWLTVNGEAIYESKPWVYQNDTLTPNIWYTSKMRATSNLPARRLYNPQSKADTIVYATVLTWPSDNQLKLASVNATSETKVSVLGYNGTLAFKLLSPRGLIIDLSSVQWAKLPNLWAWVLKFEYLAKDKRVPYMAEPRIPKSTKKSAKKMI